LFAQEVEKKSVAGVASFLRLAEAAGWKTIFLGPAVPNEITLNEVRTVRAHAPSHLEEPFADG
jgi:hypothetical protein